jgi:hypothetical protein
MKLHQILVPIRDNNGESYVAERRFFEIQLLEIAGGFTRDGDEKHGAWRNEGDGKVYRETNASYKVACDDSQWKKVIACAFNLFSDQAALFTAEVGIGTVHARPSPSPSP